MTPEEWARLSPEQRMARTPTPASRTRVETNPMDVILFRRMITPAIMGAMWLLGALVITAIGVILLVLAVRADMTAQADPLRALSVGHPLLVALAWLVGGNLLWRMLCEWWVVLFSIHEAAQEIRRGLGGWR